MSDIAIHAERLGKCYRLGQGAGPYRYHSLRETITTTFRRALALRASPTETADTLWALQDVSFEVSPGEVVGIIGRNGAGKSTLLKILSQITEPTEGFADIAGRVGSLLEVGTGFHPELTGRENVFLNGAILGMRRAEIARKFDEIVAFAEVERFIDTPVKHYSSGMYVRLAFAVAAHLEPEILLVDEVLAVGDAAFQKKCLGKLGAVTRAGLTVLFVSHNMQAIRQLCSRAILLAGGRIQKSGPAADVVDAYLRDVAPGTETGELEAAIRQLPADPAFRLEAVRLFQNGEPVRAGQVGNGQPLEIEIAYEVRQKTTGLRVFIDLYDLDANLLFRSFHDEAADGIPAVAAGAYVSRAVIPADLLAPASYDLRVLATVYNERLCIPHPGLSIPLSVDRTGRANRAYLAEPIRGKLAPVIPWRTETIGSPAPAKPWTDRPPHPS